MSIISRDYINKNIIFYDELITEVKKYDFDELSKEIDFFKNLLEGYLEGDSQKSIIIGLHPDISQTACIFACLELGIAICVIDYSRKDNFVQYDYVDPKTELLLPIDLFVVKTRNSVDKFNYFSRVCKNTIVLNEIENKNYSTNSKLLAQADTVCIRCTSSGTTDTPKIVEHTHEFIYHLAKRNSRFFDKSVGVSYNLNHGSSIATYYLPALTSTRVEKVYNVVINTNFNVNIDFADKHLDHIMIPYADHVSEFIERKSPTNVIIYTLSPIPEYYLDFYHKGKFKDVFSIFGSNETSGPTFINQISKSSFKSNLYYTIDDFYEINLINQELHVSLPYYKDKTINTHDLFEKLDIGYQFLGRKDLIKINGLPINYRLYQDIIRQKGLTQSHLITDIYENKLYLAISHNESVPVENKVSAIKEYIESFSQNKHTINKFKILNLEEFLTGVKLDQELLRHYFRKYVK